MYMYVDMSIHAHVSVKLVGNVIIMILLYQFIFNK